jgi:catechol 2,3-dioxygenase-like lactoylglutathione lyase family enzyme
MDHGCTSSKPEKSAPSTFSLTRIDHVALNVANADISAKWYFERFGFTILHSWSKPTIYIIGKGAIRIGLFEMKGVGPVKDPDKHQIVQHFAFAVEADQFQAVVDSYKRQRLKHHIEDTGVAWSVWTLDPDGFRIEVTCFYFPAKPHE